MTPNPLAWSRYRPIVCFVFALVPLAMTPAAVGQTDSLSTIDGVGEASVSVQPDYVDFWLTFRAKSNTLEESAAKALPFEKKLKEALEKKELATESVVVSGLSIPSINTPEAVVSARIRVPLPRFSPDEKRGTAFGALCDTIVAIGKMLGCAVEGPELQSENRETLEQDAVARATENALYRADAIAALMDSEIYAVQSVSVIDVKWSTGAGQKDVLPDLNRITCTARVKVVYRYAAF